MTGCLCLLLDEGANYNGGEMDSEHERKKRSISQIEGKIIVIDF